MRYYKGEILAPAGSFESLTAAVQNGADAVYLGTEDFNARVFAKNFSREELKDAVRYAHLRNVKIYVTLNTLLFDREIEFFIDLIKFLDDICIDAFIVTDFGALKIIKKFCPDMEIHASTQLTCHNLEGVIYLHSLGFSRVVLSRELSFENIRYIMENTSCEIEVFVHGALCMCYSGQCYLSSVAGERSGNRGKCAQPCRMKYRLLGEKGYFLSLKDNCLLKDVKILDVLGVHSFKIEGRMKRPEYVSSAVRMYKKALERGYNEEDEKYLEKVFSRQGFTRGYFDNNLSKDMFGIRENTVFDTEIIKNEKLFTDKEKKRKIYIKYEILKDKRIKAEFCDKENYTVVYGKIPQKALNRSVTKEDVEKSFKKLGDTHFCLEKISGETDEGLFVSAGELNEIRRRGTLELENKIITSFKDKRKSVSSICKEKNNEILKKEKDFSFNIINCFYDINVLDDEILSMSDEIFIDFLSAVENIEIFKKFMEKKPLGIRLPRIIKDDMREEFKKEFEKLLSFGIKKIMISNISHFNLVRNRDLEIYTDFSFNITNSEAVGFLGENNVDYAVLSYEMSFARIRDLKKSIPCGIIAYSKLPLMIFENCIIKNNFGCKKGDCQKGRIVLEDTKRNKFLLLREYGCKNSLRNERPLYLSDKEDYKNLGLKFVLLDFSSENSEEIKEIISSYKNGTSYVPKDFTRGLYYRKVL